MKIPTEAEKFSQLIVSSSQALSEVFFAENLSAPGFPGAFGFHTMSKLKLLGKSEFVAQMQIFRIMF